MSTTSNHLDLSSFAAEDELMLGNSPEFIAKRKTLKVLAGSLVVLAAGVSGASGSFDESYIFDNISEFQNLATPAAHDAKKFEIREFDVRNSFGLVRLVFGGTIGRTADYFGVSRKTIYQWINSEEIPNLQNRQARKAADLESAAKYVQSLIGEKSKLYVKTDAQGASLDEILASEVIDFQKLKNTVSVIKTQLAPRGIKKSSLSERLEKKGFSVRDDEDGLEPLI